MLGRQAAEASVSESISPSRYARLGAFLLRYPKAGLLNGLELDLQEAALARDARPVAPGQPEQFVDELEALGPTFIKVGQALSTRPDMVPPAYLDALERMQDNVAPVPVAEIKAVVEAELGARIGVLFGSFDD